MPDVVVVGGGIIGAICAEELARAGASVTLIERAELAAGASGRNQGWLVAADDPANEPLSRPSLAVYRAVAERAPLRVLIDEEPLGHLLVALDGDVVPDEAVANASPIDRDALLDLEPNLSSRVVGGWLDQEGYRVDPGALTVGLALLAAEAGATIRHHLSVRALTTRGDVVRGVVTDEGPIEADQVLMAAGPWSAELLETAGVRLPIRSARGWIVRLAPAAPTIRRLVERAGWRASEWRGGAVNAPTGRAYADIGVKALGGALTNPHPDGTVVVGSSREPAIGPEPGDPDVPRRQVADAIELIPALADADVRSAWWGIRPMSPDDRPLIGRVKDGLIVATAHGSEGVILGGGTAQLVRAIVEGAEPPFDPAPFDPSRFG